MPLPVPKPEMTDSSLGGGHLEVSITDDGQILLSALGSEGEFHWFKMPPVNAVGLAAALAARAQAALKAR